MFSIGQRVRVFSKSADESSRTAIISYLHQEQHLPPSSADVIYDFKQEEETEVSIDRLKPIFPWEALSKAELLQQFSATQLKDCGNQLFHLKDFAKAADFYEIALYSIDNPPKKATAMSIGTPVLFFVEESGDYLFGIVSSNDDYYTEGEQGGGGGVYEVLLSNDEERKIYEKELIEIPPDFEEQLLRRSLYSNLGKCAIKRSLRGWAVRYGSLSLIMTRAMLSLAQDTGVYDSDAEKREKLKQLLIDGLYFRGKALLLASRPLRANNDCKELKSWDDKKAKSLEAEIIAFKTKRQKDNRKLAKEIAKWVDESLNQSKAAGINKSSSLSGAEDLPVSDDLIEEEDRFEHASSGDLSRGQRFVKPVENQSAPTSGNQEKPASRLSFASINQIIRTLVSILIPLVALLAYYQNARTKTEGFVVSALVEC